MMFFQTAPFTVEGTNPLSRLLSQKGAVKSPAQAQNKNDKGKDATKKIKSPGSVADVSQILSANTFKPF